MQRWWWMSLPAVAVGVVCSIGLTERAWAKADAGQGGFEGRWDLTLSVSGKQYPSWLEVNGEEVRLVGPTGSVHPAPSPKLEGNELAFTSKEDVGKSQETKWSLRSEGGHLLGTIALADGSNGKITGEHAPALQRKTPASWGSPKKLFNGKDLSGWEPMGPGANNWKAQDGALVNVSHGANLRTKESFNDFKLHIEYNCPADGNSGVYLRGRYEVQVEYEPSDSNDEKHAMGALYGFLAPSVKLPKKPGEWESYDVTLVGRTVTVVRNGQTTIDAQEIPGITGGALNSKEAEPGPFYIQGDHTGGMKYRNITVQVPAA